MKLIKYLSAILAAFTITLNAVAQSYGYYHSTGTTMGNTAQYNYTDYNSDSWHGTSSRYGNTTYHSMCGSNGDSINGTTSVYGNTAYHHLNDSNGEYPNTLFRINSSI